MLESIPSVFVNCMVYDSFALSLESLTLDIVRVTYTHAQASRAPLMAARRLRLLRVNGISEEVTAGKAS